jgi:hypothetical protein
MGIAHSVLIRQQTWPSLAIMEGSVLSFFKAE